MYKVHLYGQCAGYKGDGQMAPFHSFIALENRDVIIRTESHLSASYSNTQFFSLGYQPNFLEKRSNIHRGDVVTAPRDTCTLSELELTDNDCILVMSKLFTLSFSIATFYIPTHTTLQN